MWWVHLAGFLAPPKNLPSLGKYAPLPWALRSTQTPQNTLYSSSFCRKRDLEILNGVSQDIPGSEVSWQRKTGILRKTTFNSVFGKSKIKGNAPNYLNSKKSGDSLGFTLSKEERSRSTFTSGRDKGQEFLQQTLTSVDHITSTLTVWFTQPCRQADWRRVVLEPMEPQPTIKCFLMQKRGCCTTFLINVTHHPWMTGMGDGLTSFTCSLSSNM